MGWLKNISDFHVVVATLTGRLDSLSKGAADISSAVVQHGDRISRLEGAVAGSTNGELLRQVLELRREIELLKMSRNTIDVVSIEQPILSLPKRGGSQPPSVNEDVN
jgi:hypothetical protein